MNRQAVQLILVAALVAIAGCAGGMGGDLGNDSPTDDSSTTDSSDGGMGTAAFYVSDDPSVIDDFRHLNVTITKVGFKRTGNLSDGDSNETDSSGNETDGDDENESGDGSEPVNETDTEADKDTEADDGASDEHWVEYDVDNQTVDLTELKGANASLVDEFELPAGDYEKVFIYVSDTEGILTDGSETKVKLPSNKLHINSKFTVGDGDRVDFVYDIAPHKAGKSGKYILKPVISQSGTGDDIEIRDVDRDKDDGEQKNGNDDKRHGDGENRAKGK
ncbi:DUF4382 domain-containing protein [Natrinema zhouii]|uniref:DUF4382 domain-containing protein n=1 Tax=Natrinema zhouii TaxID=1710539 RepID=A0A7D6GPS6_9EURY|nr:DUF4382 domain-containing protein [Natrinema zhouii]QLK24463.1 DUF4382 domain-containing protein [Natrinema zhouii]